MDSSADFEMDWDVDLADSDTSAVALAAVAGMEAAADTSVMALAAPEGMGEDADTMVESDVEFRSM